VLLPIEQVILFFLPAMAANLVLYLTGYYFGPAVVVPLDQKIRLGGRRLIGDGRGLTSLPRALAAGMVCGAIQGRLEEAVVLALGAQFGMVCNSLVKRRRGLPQGESHQPWDHLDFVFGASLVYAVHYHLDISMFVSGVLYCGACHLVVGHLVRAVLEPRKA
jgi:hypothetical protein